MNPDTAFMLGYLYSGSRTHNDPIWLTKRVFDDGSCEVWGGIRNNKRFVGTWWKVATVDPNEAEAYLQACRNYLLNDAPTTIGRADVEIVRWGDWA